MVAEGYMSNKTTNRLRWWSEPWEEGKREEELEIFALQKFRLRQICKSRDQSLFRDF